MFYTNEEISERLNSIYNNGIIKQTNGFSLPEKEKLLELLMNRKLILFFYLSSERGEPEKIEPNGDYIPTVNMKLLSFFASPYGDKLWCDDNSLKYLAMSNELIPQDLCTNIVNKQFESYISIRTNEERNFNDFVKTINK